MTVKLSGDKTSYWIWHQPN